MDLPVSLAVLKLGGSVLQTIDDFHKWVPIIEQQLTQYERICIVVSALKGMTNELLEQAHQLSSNPSRRELDMLVSIGERMAASLLCISLEQHDIKARSYTGSQAGIITSCHHTQAQIIDVQPFRLLQAFATHRVVVVAGFQGISFETKEITTLGRGGSDTSAVALAAALQASRVIFFKDVGRLYTDDPLTHKHAEPLSFCDYETAASLMNRKKFMLHPRSIQLAKLNQIPLHIASLEQPLCTGSLIATHPTQTDRIDFTNRAVYEHVPV